MIRETRRAGACLLALGSVVALLTLLAGPAGAQTSGGAVAVDGSVASGEAHAARGSTASGESTATDGSVASGCSFADNYSTASGDDSCDRRPPPTVRPPVTVTPTTAVRPPTGGGATATPARRLALTGSWSTPMAATAALAIALGTLMVIAGSDRRRASTRA
jgi:hypothetical protein